MPLINFSGLASGIDSEALIEATSTATRATRVDPLEEQVTEITETNSALDELNTLLNNVKNTAEDFRTFNAGVLAKSGTSSDETVISAVASGQASLGTYELNVAQLAENAIFSFNERTTDTSANIITTPAENGAIQIDYGLGDNLKTISIDVDDSTSWSELTSLINSEAESAGMNISASLVNVGTTSSASYALFINGNEIGTEEGTISVNTTVANSGSAGTDLNSYIDSATATTSQAQDAQFSITGITGTITRSSNTVNDIIPGLTLNLQSVGGPTSVKVEVDASTTQSRIQEFIDQYNELVDFINENNEITRIEDGDEVSNVFAALASTRVDDNALQSIRNAMSSTVYDPDGVGAEDTDPDNENLVRIFADLGIITDRDTADGRLKFVTEGATVGQDFQEAIASDPDSISNLFASFAETIASTQGTIDQFTGFNNIIDLSERANERLISDTNDRIGRAEDAIAQTEATLRARFARLESLTSRLQSEQQALTSALAGLG